MKNYTKSIFIILLFSTLFGCQLDNKKNKEVKEQQVTETAQEIQEEKSPEIVEQVAEVDPFREPTDDEIREFGLVKEVEDGIYPIFTITIEFPEREMKHSFNVNHGALSGFTGDLFSLIGKYISFYYTEDWENDLIDMHLNGKTLSGESAPEMDSEWESITGVLSGAEQTTQSDLPSIINVTDIDGNIVNFKYYVEEDMLKANGKEVQVYYSFKGVSNITHISPLED